jgi:penicillin-binding protein 2
VFDRRLRVLLTVFGVALAVIVVRLGQLQVVQASYYREQAERAVFDRPAALAFVRGGISDRTGEVLVRDEARWDLTVDYSVIAADGMRDAAVMLPLAKRWERRGFLGGAPSEEGLIEALCGRLDATWRQIAFFANDRDTTVGALRERAAEIHGRVTAIREAVSRRRGFDARVAEETHPHPILTALSAERQVEARERLADFPWVHLEPAAVRQFVDDGAAFAHVLGRVGRVTAEDVGADPNADDPFAAYRGDEVRGITGIEWVAEQRLRGRRGQLVHDREGRVVETEYFAPQNGEDLTLTIHAGLQRRLYRLLEEAVQRVPASSGGAIVVVDVPTREVLALVSYPAYDPNQFEAVYADLRDDTDRLPLWFRTVASRYAPGSTVKPLVCLASLMNHVITLDTPLECTGYLLDKQPDRWRCWKIHGTDQRKAHGMIDVVEALTGSCNVFMYRVGEMLGVDRLCSAFDMFGIGRTTGLGLREEDSGINPTPSWLMVEKNVRVTPGTARLFAIGQGEVSMTPVQVANLMATYASGRFRPLTLLRDGGERPEWRLPAEPGHWLAIKRGMFGVVNDPEGTAYQFAHFVHDRYALAGKTGSATAYPWPTSYRVPYVGADGQESVAVVRAGALDPAIERFERDYPDATFDPGNVEPATYWPRQPPPPGERHSHAWFGGFLQEVGAGGEPVWNRRPRVAFAVLVEFGGSGGRTSGPLARDVAAALIEVLGPDVDAQ